MGKIFPATEKANECPTPLRGLITNRPAEHRIGFLESVEDRALRHGLDNLEFHLVVDAGERAQVDGEDDADHARLTKFEAPNKFLIFSGFPRAGSNFG